jgi:hypothetical protein
MTVPVLFGIVILLLAFISMNKAHNNDVNKELINEKKRNKQLVEILNEKAEREQKIPNLIKKILESNNFRLENSKYDKNIKLVLNTDLYKFIITICEEEEVILYGGSLNDGRVLLKIDYANNIIPKTNFKYNLYDNIDLFSELHDFITKANTLCNVKYHPFNKNN